MGQKTLCCSSQQFAQTNCGHKGQSVSITSFSNCAVSLSFGIIFNEDVDCVVVVGNTKLKLGPNTIKQIKQFGGPSVMNELRQVLLDEGGKLDLGRVVYTHAGDMDYEYIFYAVLPNCCDSSVQLIKGSYAFNNGHGDEYQPSGSYQENLRIQDGIQVYTEKLGDSVQTHERQNIYECVINCLQKAMELGIQSIALPFMEPSVIHISKAKIVATMLFAIKQFLKENNKCSLTEIRINTQDLQTRNLFKYYIERILIDQSESTMNEIFPNEQEQKKRQSSSFSSQTDNNLNVDEIMKFCHNIKDDTQHNKHKSSF